MAIRAVAVDVDGTVTDMERRLDLVGVDVLRQVEARGIPVIPATGNAMPVARAFSAFVGLSGPIVCENGGAVYHSDLSQKRILHSRVSGDRAFEHLAKQGLPVRRLWSDSFRESEVAIELNVDPDEVRHHLSGWDLNVVSTRFAIHLMEPGLSKLEGLVAALDFLPRPVRLEEVLAIGDSRNDVEMLEACSASAAVANATPEAKAAAKYVAKEDFGRGVAEALRHYGLLEEASTVRSSKRR